MVLSAGALGLESPACLLAAMAGERDPLRSRDADIRPRLALLERGGAGARIRESARQIARQASLAAASLPKMAPGFTVDEAEQAGVLLALAYPDRLAQKRGKGSFRMVSGRGGFLEPDDPLAEEEVLAIGAVNGGSGNARIWQAAPLSLETVAALFQSRFRETEEVVWDPREEAVQARRRVGLGAFVVEERPLGGKGLADRTARAVLEGIRSLGLGCLPWTEELEQWRLRVRLVREADPNGGWPDVSDEALLRELDEWLEPFVQGISRRSQFSRIDLASALHALLPWNRQRALEDAAHAHGRSFGSSAAALRMHGGRRRSRARRQIAGILSACRRLLPCGRQSACISVHCPGAGRPLQITRGPWRSWKTRSNARAETVGPLSWAPVAGGTLRGHAHPADQQAAAAF